MQVRKTSFSNECNSILKMFFNLCLSEIYQEIEILNLFVIFKWETKSTKFQILIISHFISRRFYWKSSILFALLKSYQILWVGLCVVKNNKYFRVSLIVNHRIIQYMGGCCSWFIRGNLHSMCPLTELPSQNSTLVNSLISAEISRTILVTCRVRSIYSKIHTISINPNWKLQKYTLKSQNIYTLSERLQMTCNSYNDDFFSVKSF